MRIENSNFMARVACGQYKGNDMVVDMGEKTTRVAVFKEGRLVDSSVIVAGYGGDTVTSRLQTLVNQSGWNFMSKG